MNEDTPTRRKMDDAVIAATAITRILDRLDTDDEGKVDVLRIAERMVAFSAPRRPRSLGDVIARSRTA